MQQINEVRIAQLFAECAQKYAEMAPSVEKMEAFNQALEAARSVVWSSGIGTSGDGLKAKPRVFMGMPYCHGAEVSTLKALLVEFSDDLVVPDFHDWSSSLLAHSFNNLWCTWLNHARPHDYFLLCHADIGFRTKSFLDPLVKEMERGGWDVLHVPQPIKDGRGLTSTAVGERGKPWASRRRLTMAELDRLPDAFGLPEMLEVMGKEVPADPVFLPNTAVFFVRLADWCWDFPGFEIRDRIDRRCDQGKVMLHANVVPEDWNFGHWASTQGLKVGGCKAVKCDHWLAKACFKNDEVWGETQDELYLSKHRGDSSVQQAIEAMGSPGPAERDEPALREDGHYCGGSWCRP